MDSDGQPLAEWRPLAEILYKPLPIQHGVYGEKIYEGKIISERCKIKKITNRNITKNKREIDALKTFVHPNIIQCYGVKEEQTTPSSTTYFFVLNWYEGSVKDYVDNLNNFRDEFKDINQKMILYQSALGLAYLHSHQIVHRDLNPFNILIRKDSLGVAHVMLSNFGFAKNVRDGESYASMSRSTNEMEHSFGWLAPELGRLTTYFQNSDVFSLGCIFYYVLSNGKHPYGDLDENWRYHQMFMLQSKINADEKRSNFNRKKLAKTFSDNKIQDYNALRLIHGMLRVNHYSRIPSQLIAQHLYFWETSKQIAFLQKVSDTEEEDRKHTNKVGDLLNKISYKVFNNGHNGWINKIATNYPGLAADIGSRTYWDRNTNSWENQYDTNKTSSLLRAFRNTEHHILRYEQFLNNQNLIDIFKECFPILLYYVYKAMKLCENETLLKEFYSKDMTCFFKPNPTFERRNQKKP